MTTLRPDSESVPISPVLALPLGEAARSAGISRATLWRRLKAGTGPKVAEVGGRKVIRLSSLDAWLASLERDRVTPQPKAKGARG
jgi:predicted DNA-binding transcriptional regulator AlpA